MSMFRKTIINNLTTDIEPMLILQGKIMAELNKSKTSTNIQDYEFKVTSQTGEDGIIQYLINKIPIKNKVFVEFGVENYTEANTRFLLQNDNWSGLIIDGSKVHMDSVKNSTLGWKYDVKTVPSFITKDNINDIIKSVGEVMAIGRTFIEALQKACQSLEIGRDGLGADGKQKRKLEEIVEGLENPSWNRLFLIKDALSLGVPLNTVHKITKVDLWFLNQIQKLVNLEQDVRRYNLNNLPEDLFWEIKKHGYADMQIAYLLGNCTEDEVYEKRKGMGITRAYKMVDTCAAEFPSETNYFYSTFETPAQ